MTSLLSLFLLAVALPTAPGQVAPRQPELASKPTSGGTDTTTETPWTKFRHKLTARLAAERRRLRKLLEKNYLSDLSLNYDDRDNRAYLRRKIAELAHQDPDMGGVLIQFLNPTGGGSALQNRADNARRILAQMDLEAYRPALHKMIKTGGTGGRIRALSLLVDQREPGLTPTLQRFLTETLEAWIPAVLDCVGRYGDVALAKAVLPFLNRPSEVQRLHALGALTRLHAKETIAPAAKAAKSIGTAAAWEALQALLSATAPHVTADEQPALQSAAEDILMASRNVHLDKRTLLGTLRVLQGQSPQQLATHKAATVKLLRGFLDHRLPEVQFAAANLLNRLGDKTGIKHVLARLDVFVKRNRKVPYAYYQRARAKEAFGKIGDALRDVSQAIKYSSGSDPAYHLFAARLEVKKGSPGSVLRHLRDAGITTKELRRFRKNNPAIEQLIERSRSLRKLFGDT